MYFETVFTSCFIKQYIVNQGKAKPWNGYSLQRSPSYIEEISPRISPLPRCHSMLSRDSSQLPKQNRVLTSRLSLPPDTFSASQNPSEEVFEEHENDDVFELSDENDEITHLEEEKVVGRVLKNRQSQPAMSFQGQILDPSLNDKRFVCIHPYDPSNPAGLWLDYGDIVQG